MRIEKQRLEQLKGSLEQERNNVKQLRNALEAERARNNDNSDMNELEVRTCVHVVFFITDCNYYCVFMCSG